MKGSRIQGFQGSSRLRREFPVASLQSAGEGLASGRGRRLRREFDSPPVEGRGREDGHGAGEGFVVEARGGGVDFGLPFG